MLLYNHLGGSNNIVQRQETIRDNLWRAGNPTVGTGIAYTNDTTAWSATAGIMNVYNSDTTVKRLWIEPLKLVMRMTSINTSGTSLNLVFMTDTATRYSSGGTAITPTQIAWADPVYVSGYANHTNYATIHFGALVLGAA